MKTYWCRLYCDPSVKLGFIDSWVSGWNAEADKQVLLFAVRAESEKQIHEMLAARIPRGGYEVDSLTEQPWKTFGDFAGPKSRFRMDAKYLKDEIDTVEVALSRTAK